MEPAPPPDPPRLATAEVTRRFFALTPERILDAVESIGRRATGRVLALNSLENRVYEVEMEEGEPLVGKFYRPGRWSEAAILEEHAFLAELEAEEVPVVAPLPQGPSGSTLGALPLDDAGGEAIRFALFPKVRGRPPEDLTGEQLEWLGRLLARLHAVGARGAAPARGRLDATSYGRRSLAILRATGVVPEALAQRHFAVAERLVEACAERLAAVPAPAIRIHGDCHLGNLIWRADGPRFLDFDDFLAGPPVQDVWLLCPGHDDEARAQREAVVRGYQTLRDFDPATLALVEPLRALRILRYAGWIAERWQDPTFSRAFPDFREASFWQREIQALQEQAARVAD